jgi:DNA-binding transcriptional ArsR family regulator
MIIQKSRRTDRAFHALADPTRRRILEQLGQFTISQPAVTKHLNVLEAAGLISRRKAGRQRICKAEPAGLLSAAQWMATWSAYWNDRLDGLEDFLARTPAPRS